MISGTSSLILNLLPRAFPCGPCCDHLTLLLVDALVVSPSSCLHPKVLSVLVHSYPVRPPFFLPFRTLPTLRRLSPVPPLLRNPFQLDFESILLLLYAPGGGLIENTLVSWSLASLVFCLRLPSSNRNPTGMA